MHSPEDPTRWIYYVIGTGFFSANVVALCFFVKDMVFDDPSIIITLSGSFLGFGVFGSFIGTFAGLGVRMMLERHMESKALWMMAISTSCFFSAAAGFFASWFLSTLNTGRF